MKNIKLRHDEIPFLVNSFEDRTNKVFPYYQNGAKYALCPTCGSSVQIINGKNNNTQNVSQTIYASHTKSSIDGLPYDEKAKLNCPSYSGNLNNWQKIYQKSAGLKNKEVEKYIELNIIKIALEVEKIIGFKCVYRKSSTSNLFESIYNSFKANGGLYIGANQFVPEYIPMLIIARASAVKCWGAILIDDGIKKKIKSNKLLGKSLEQEPQFQPNGNVKIVGVLDDDNTPENLEIRLLIPGGKPLILKRMSANI